MPGSVWPPGDPGRGRSIKRLCLDHHLSSERDRLPAIYAGGELAAVWRLGVDEAFIPSAGAPCRFIRIERSAEKEDAVKTRTKRLLIIVALLRPWGRIFRGRAAAAENIQSRQGHGRTLLSFA